VIAGVALVLSGACGDDSKGDEGECRVGSEACPCYRDDTCDDDLVCLSDLCVYDPDAAGAGGRGPGSKAGDAGGSDLEGGSDATGSGGRTGAAGADPGSGGSSSPRGGNTSSGGSSAAGPTPVEKYGALSVKGTTLVDSEENPVKLEGMSSMWLNWEPTGYALSRDGLAWMRDNWDLRVFRIAMGVYSPDDLENTYLANPTQNEAWVDTIVQNAIDVGVYVIIDWHDHEALSHQAEAIAFFDEMSAKWGEYPNVIYETFNEPLDLDWTTQLKPYHQSLVNTIRANDPDNLILLGTPNWDQDVDVAAASPLAGANLMYTLHFYACTHGAAFRNRAKTALNAGLPLFVSEWGSTDADGGLDQAVCEPETRAWHDWMDQEYISWTAWKLDGCDDSTCMFKDRTAPVDGGWTSGMLNGHAPIVIDEMLNGPSDGGGSGSGGTSGSGGSPSGGSPSGGSGTGGGPSGIDLDEKPEACGVITTCPSCCLTSAVFALDSKNPPNDRTLAYVTAWNGSASQASAEFDFQAYDEVGAILFKFSELQSIVSLGVDASASGGLLEVALVKDGGASGCIYIEDSLGWYENGCWGTPDATFDQIEVRVRSLGGGPAALSVRQIVYE
jgi:endoglucanase